MDSGDKVQNDTDAGEINSGDSGTESVTIKKTELHRREIHPKGYQPSFSKSNKIKASYRSNLCLQLYDEFCKLFDICDHMYTYY